MTDEQTKSFTENLGKFHDKYYKHLLLIPILLLAISFAYIFIFYSNTGDFIRKDISLTGGTSATIYGKIDSEKLKSDLLSKLNEIGTREIYDLITGEKIAVIIQTKSSGAETKKILEDYLGYVLNDKNSSFEFSGSLISQSFYKQLLIAMLSAFLLMSIVVFIMFRTFIPSFAVILAAFSDIFMTLVVVNYFGIEMSSAGIVAFLMLIGYSVDTDILLTNKVLRSHEGSLNGKILTAFKTGMTMTFTAIVAVSIGLYVSLSFSVVLTQIFTILLIGLGFDILNTWVEEILTPLFQKIKPK